MKKPEAKNLVTLYLFLKTSKQAPSYSNPQGQASYLVGSRGLARFAT
jgi:hypothetical protein